MENHWLRQKMILFYSEFCQHCRMLIETIRRHDSKNTVKLACIEGLKKLGKPIPVQIHSVPALIVKQTNGERRIMFGKQVFDYLLAPGSGKLHMPASTAGAGAGAIAGDGVLASGFGKAPETPNEPMAFVLGGGGSSDAFSPIEDETTGGRVDRIYNWTHLEEIPATATSTSAESPYQEETRKKQELPEIDVIMARRELELTQENYINVNALTPPSFTRP